jgi:formimidoylglutamate deiminase
MPETRLWFESALLPEGWTAQVRCTLAHGRIARVERGVPPADADARHAIGVPGLLNVHSHAFQRAMAGLAERRSPGSDSFWTWRDTMYRFVERLDPDDVEVVACQAYMEMLESGFTRVGEFHYLHHDPTGRPYADDAEMATRIVAAAAETGIGLTLLPSFYAHAGFGGLPPASGQRRFITSVDAFARLVDGSRRAIASLDDANLGLAPHSLRAVTPEELEAVVALANAASPASAHADADADADARAAALTGSDAARARPVPIHMHVAEQMKEVDDCIAWSGAPPVSWLLDHAPVDDRWCLIHGTHATAPELRAVASRGAVIGLCPITEGSLGDGVFGARTFLAEGGAITIGTDSNVLIDAAQELRTLEYVQRLAHRERNVLTATPGDSSGRTLFDAVRAGGARALAVDAGRIAEGALADLIALDPNHAALAGRSGDALLDGWIFAARELPIDRVWRGGREVVTGGRHVHRQAIDARFRRTLARLLASS